MFMQATAGLRALGIDASDRILQAVNVASYCIFSSCFNTLFASYL